MDLTASDGVSMRMYRSFNLGSSLASHAAHRSKSGLVRLLKRGPTMGLSSQASQVTPWCTTAPATSLFTFTLSGVASAVGTPSIGVPTVAVHLVALAVAAQDEDKAEAAWRAA